MDKELFLTIWILYAIIGGAAAICSALVFAASMHMQHMMMKRAMTPPPEYPYPFGNKPFI